MVVGWPPTFDAAIKLPDERVHQLQAEIGIPLLIEVRWKAWAIVLDGDLDLPVDSPQTDADAPGRS